MVYEVRRADNGKPIAKFFSRQVANEVAIRMTAHRRTAANSDPSIVPTEYVVEPVPSKIDASWNK